MMGQIGQKCPAISAAQRLHIASDGFAVAVSE